jgi:hypothetical protein
LLYLHQRRCGLLRNVPEVLRLHDGDDEVWLHLLPVHERHAGLLLRLLTYG